MPTQNTELRKRDNGYSNFEDEKTPQKELGDFIEDDKT